ncbi:hypothetical protein ACFL0Y_00470 [Patescibacteria group bacterium]
MNKKEWDWVDWTKVGAIFVVGACLGMALVAVWDMAHFGAGFVG